MEFKCYYPLLRHTAATRALMSEHCDNMTALNIWAYHLHWSATLHAVRTTSTGADLQVQKMDVMDQGAQMEPLLPAVRRSLISRVNTAARGICRIEWSDACVRERPWLWLNDSSRVICASAVRKRHACYSCILLQCMLQIRTHFTNAFTGSS